MVYDTFSLMQWPAARESISRVFNEPETAMRNLSSEYFPWLLIVGLYVVAGFFFPDLFKQNTFLQVLLQTSAIVILAIGMAYTLIVAEIDLSIVSILLFAPLVGHMAVVEFNLPSFMMFVVGAGVGLLAGFVNGWVVTRIGVPSLIMTLASWWTLQGAALSLTGGRTVSNLPDVFSTFGTGSVGPIRYLILVAIAVIVIMWYYSVYTVNGRRMFLVGGDPDAASRMGIDPKKYRMHAFLISGLLASIGGFVMIGRVGIISSQIGQDALMPAIAAPVIAGVSLFGGKGKLINVPAGALLVTTIITIVRKAGVSGTEYQLFQGLLVFVAVVLMELKRGEGLLGGD